MKIRVEHNAYVTEFDQEQFADGLRAGDADTIANALTFNSRDMSGYWTPVGTATITVEIADESDIRTAMAKTLEAERNKVLAEAQAKATELNAKIQSLLAITYNGE